MPTAPALRALTAGSGDPAVLLLHGFGVGPLPYRPAIERLATRVRVVAPWLVGRAYPWTFDGVVDALQATLDANELRDVHVVGHSFGGAIAIGLADREPDRVRGLTLVDSMGVSPGLLRMAALGLRPGNARLLSPELARDLVGFLSRNPRELAAAAWWAYRCNLLALVGRLARRQLDRHVLWGRDDTLLPVQVGEQLAAALEATWTVVTAGPGRVGHDWPMRRPVLFADTVLGLLPHTAN